MSPNALKARPHGVDAGKRVGKYETPPLAVKSGERDHLGLATASGSDHTAPTAIHNSVEDLLVIHLRPIFATAGCSLRFPS